MTRDLTRIGSKARREAKTRFTSIYHYVTDLEHLGTCYKRLGKGKAFRCQVTRMLFKWLNRRSQRRSYTWERFNNALAWVGWPSVHVVHHLNPFRKVGLKDC
jgi:hypothetical protein